MKGEGRHRSSLRESSVEGALDEHTERWKVGGFVPYLRPIPHETVFVRHEESEPSRRIKNCLNRLSVGICMMQGQGEERKGGRLARRGKETTDLRERLPVVPRLGDLSSL